jgi:hypothetical protein
VFAVYSLAGRPAPRMSYLYFLQAEALALAGRLEEARPIAQRGLELFPGWRIGLYAAFGIAPAILDKIVEGARLLGLPVQKSRHLHARIPAANRGVLRDCRLAGLDLERSSSRPIERPDSTFCGRSRRGPKI